MGQDACEGLFAPDVMLAGRVTDDGFAAARSTMQGTGGVGERMNGTTTYAVSTTMTEPIWQTTPVPRDEPMGAIRRCEAGVDRETPSAPVPIWSPPSSPGARSTNSGR